MAQRRFVLDQPGGNLALDLFVLSQHLGAMVETAFTGTGVTPAQYAVYSQLGEQAMTPRRVGATLGLAPATARSLRTAGPIGPAGAVTADRRRPCRSWT